MHELGEFAKRPMSAYGAVADWQLSASAVINGNGKNWVESRLAAFEIVYGESGPQGPRRK